jgi:hypothetical protein
MYFGIGHLKGADVVDRISLVLFVVGTLMTLYGCLWNPAQWVGSRCGRDGRDLGADLRSPRLQGRDDRIDPGRRFRHRRADGADRTEVDRQTPEEPAERMTRPDRRPSANALHCSDGAVE